MTALLRSVAVVVLLIPATQTGQATGLPRAESRGLSRAQSRGLSRAQSRGRALAIEDYYKIPTVGGAQISPNGRFVSFSVLTRVESDNSTRTEAYVVPADGLSKQRPIRHEGAAVTNTSWTADSLLRYTAGGRTWTLDPSDAGASPLVTDAAPASGPQGGGGRGGRGAAAGAAGALSPDGQWRVGLRDKVTPKPTVAETDFERRHEERFKGVIIDYKDFQRDGAPFPTPDPHALPPQQIVLQPSVADRAPIIVDPELRPGNLIWHPGGKLLAFAADPDWRNELKYESPDLFTVTTEGKVTRLTNDDYVYSDLTFSPDGKYLAYARTFGTDMIIKQKLNHGGSKDLFIRPVTGGEPINLTASWDLEPGNARWSPDSRFVYFSAAIGGEDHLFRIAIPDGSGSTTAPKVEQVTKGERRVNGISFDKAMKTIAYTVGLHDALPEVYSANIDGTNERKLTDISKSTQAEIQFGQTERLHWPSYDGTQIEGWLTAPYGYDPAPALSLSNGRTGYPLIVFSHGGPHDATGYGFDFKKQYFAANGYFVLDTNFRSSTGYGDAFKWATWGEWGKKDGEDVVSGIDYVLKRYPIDPKRVGHTGHPYCLSNYTVEPFSTTIPDINVGQYLGGGYGYWIRGSETGTAGKVPATQFGSHQDAGDYDQRINETCWGYYQILEAYESLSSTARASLVNQGTPTCLEAGLDPVIFAGTNAIASPLVEVIWGLENSRSSQEASGAVSGGTNYGEGLLNFETSDDWPRNLYTWYPDPVVSFNYAFVAAKLARLLIADGFTALGGTYQTSAIAAYDWAVSIITNTTTRDAWFAPTKLRAGWSTGTYNTAMTNMINYCARERASAAASLYALTASSTYKTVVDAYGPIGAVDVRGGFGAWEYAFRSPSPNAGIAANTIQLYKDFAAASMFTNMDAPDVSYVCGQSAGIWTAGTAGTANSWILNTPTLTFAALAWTRAGTAPDLANALKCRKNLQLIAQHRHGANQLGLCLTNGLGVRHNLSSLHQDSAYSGQLLPWGIGSECWINNFGILPLTFGDSQIDRVAHPQYEPDCLLADPTFIWREIYPYWQLAWPRWEMFMEINDAVEMSEFTTQQQVLPAYATTIYLHGFDGNAVTGEETTPEETPVLPITSRRRFVSFNM